MHIDWFTLVAQVVNFLVLVWLLKRLLYGRIVKAMDEREARITARLEEAARQRAEAEHQSDLYRDRNQELEQRREQLLAQAREESEASRQRLVEDARREVEQLQEQWFEVLHRDKAEILRDFQERTAERVLAVARRVLKDLADAELEQQMLAVFLKQVRRTEPEKWHALLEVLREPNRGVELRTSFPVNAKLRQGIIQDFREHLKGEVAIRFETDPQIGCGIELRADSQRLLWSVDSYLDALEASVFQSLEERARPHDRADERGRGRSRVETTEDSPR